MRVAAIVLAAGRSTRMGQPKASLRCRETTFLGAILETLEAGGVSTVRVVVGHAAEEILQAHALPESVCVLNPDHELGMLSSIRRGISSLPPATEAFFLWPVDHPLVEPATIVAIVDAWQRTGAGVVVPVRSGRRGHPVLFACRLAPELLAAPDEIGARAVVRAHRSDRLEIEVEDKGVVTDIDTPEAYRLAFGRLPAAGPQAERG